MALQDPSDPSKKQPRDLGYKKFPALTAEDSQLLKDIAMMESSDNLNIDHEEITDPNNPQFGQRARGKYGFMPLTLAEFRKRAFDKGEVPYEMRNQRDLSPEELAAQMQSNPELEEANARLMLEHLRSKGLNDEQAALAWEAGHNLSPESLQKKINLQVQKPGTRASKFRTLRNKLAK